MNSRYPEETYYILREGVPVLEPDLLTWARGFENIDNRRVALDRIGEVEISTVFLGFNHNFARTGDPILWETLVSGGGLDGYIVRYTSVAAAREGHAALVQEVREKGPENGNAQ